MSREINYTFWKLMCLAVADVKKSLNRVNPPNITEPDNNPGRVLRECEAGRCSYWHLLESCQCSNVLQGYCHYSCANNVLTFPPLSSWSASRGSSGGTSRRSCHPCWTRSHCSLSIVPTTPNATNLHLALTHLDTKDPYVLMLFMDFSSASRQLFLSTWLESWACWAW